MLSIDAVSLAPAARDWLINSNCPRFLHVFDHACNLINERGDVLSIVTSQIGNGPFNLVIDADRMFSRYLDVRSPISVRSGSLDLGDLKIRVDASQLWCPQPDWHSLYVKRYEILNQLQQLPITKHQSLISNLTAALANANISMAKTAASQLAGLGIGLTPAGDDYILGAAMAAWIIHPKKDAEKLAKEITKIAAPLTTSLSASWLRAVGRGEAGVLWHHLFDALFHARDTNVQFYLARLLSVGETSGADALAGFFGTFVSWAE